MDTNPGQIDTNRELSQRANLLHKDLSYKLQGVFFNVRNKYGKYHKEHIYHNALLEELEKQNIVCVSEPRLDVFSLMTGKKLGAYVPDFLVENAVIVELKALPYAGEDMYQQLIEYLKTSRYELAYLVNFGEEKFKPRRFIHTADRKFVGAQITANE